MNEPRQVPPVHIESPATDQLLRNSIVKDNENHATTHTLLTHNLVKGDENAKTSHALAMNQVEMQGKTRDAIDKGASEVAKAVESLKPISDAASFVHSFLASIKGDKGDQGETGVQGVQGEKGDKGDKGDASTVPGPQGPQGERGPTGMPGRDGRDGLDGKDGKDGRDGNDGKDGKDGSPDEGDDIVAKHRALPKEKRISYHDLKDAPEFSKMRGGGTGYLREITDVDVSGLQDGQTLKWSAAKQRWIVGEASGATPKVYDLSASLDGSTKSFTIPANTAIVSVTSSSAPFTFRPTVDYTGSGTTTLAFTSGIDAASMLASGQTLLVIYY